MFGSGSGSGNGGFGGFGANNQQSNTGSVFGGGGGFGQPSNTGFGGTGTTGSAFGSTTPTTTSAFGSTSGGFGSGGGFGSNNTGGAFGAAKPAFGSTAPAPGGGLFGSNTANTAPSTGFGFGQSNTTSAFGGGNTGGGLFANKAPFGSTPSTSTPSGGGGGLFGTAGPTGGAFGATTSSNPIGFGGSSTQLTTGTQNPPFEVYVENDGPSSNSKCHFQTITFRDPYKNYSFEELRLMDYAQGRRYGNGSGTGGAFGFGTGFGNTGTSTTNTGFGATPAPSTGGGLFGNNSGTSAFGSNTSNTGGGGFGSAPSGGGLFGSKPAGGGLFGSNPTTTPATGGGLFGNSNPGTSTGGFGSGTTGGGFGSTGGGGGLFGNNQQNQQNQPKPGFAFGNTSTTPSTGFGATNTSTGFGSTAPATGGGLFGNNQQQQQQQQQSSTPAFGSNTGSTFGSAFGQNNQQPQQSTPAFGSAFGQNQQQKPAFGGGFGSTPASNTTNTGGGLFGNNSATQNSGGGLFGNKPATGFGPTTTPSTGGGLFGNTQSNTGGGGLFGNNTSTPATGGSLFGNNNQTNSGGSLFGNSQSKPAGSLFGNNTSTPASGAGGSLFGNMNNSQPQSGSLFGNSQSQPQNSGSSMFGNSTSLFNNSQQQQQQPFGTSINDSPYGNNQFLASLGASQSSTPLGPIATPLSASQTKKAAMIPHNKIAPRQAALAPRLSQSFSRSASPFSSSVSSSFGASGIGRSLSTSKLNLFDSDESVLSSGAFTPNGNSRTQSLKKLVIDRKIRDQDLFAGDAEPRLLTSESSRSPATRGILKKTVSFDVNNDQESVGNGSPSGAALSAQEMGYLRSTPDRRGNNGTPGSASTNGSPATGNEVALVDDTPEDKSEGTYFMIPSAQKLKVQSKESLKKVLNLVVGRRGYGQVRFDNPVDLTGLPCDIEDIPGTVVTFDKRVCTVYPENLEKPLPGHGLNVPATITLQDCFPVSKNERGKIRDPEHPRYQTHIKRLRNIKDTEFVDYVANEGIWIFKVRHFTSYGLSDDEDEDDIVVQDNTSMMDDSTLSSLPSSTPASIDARETPSQILDDDMEGSDADASAMTSDSQMDDTFDFKRLNSSVGRRERELPGSFLDENDYSDGVSYEEAEGDFDQDQGSFLGQGSVGSVDEEEEPAEPMSESELAEDSTIIMDDSREDISQLVSAADERVMTDDEPTPTKGFLEAEGGATPKALPVGKDWTEQLINTISPVKRRVPGESFIAKTAKESSPFKKSAIQPLKYGLLDLNRDLYGSPAKSLRGGGMDAFSPGKKASAARSQEGARSAKKPAAGKARPHERFDYSKLDDVEKAWRKSVRPTWGRDGKIIHRGKLDGLARRRTWKDDGSLQYAKLKTGTDAHALPKALGVQLEGTEIDLDEWGVPYAKTKHDFPFERFAEAAWGHDPKEQHERNVWALAGVLWDKIADIPQFAKSNEQTLAYIEEKARKERLSQFLERLVERDVERHEQAATTLEEVAFCRLTAHRVEAACAALLEAGDLRLATLITLAGADDSVRDEIKKQLEIWRAKGVLSEISVSMRALYELVAGETCFSQGVKGPVEDAAPDFYISDHFGLDWRRSLGLKLWYGCHEEEGIREAVEIYEREMQKYPGKTPIPVPWYHTEADDTERRDILWGLLQLYAHRELNLEHVLDPLSMGVNPINYRLAWQLRVMLSRQGVRDLSGSALWVEGEQKTYVAGEGAKQLTAEFAGMLEMSGLWEWAVFVVMHLDDADSREILIRNIVGRYVDDIEIGEAPGGKLDFLLHTLHVPEKWIFESKALQARSEGQYVIEAEHLLAAEAWDAAHTTVVRQVAPDAIIAADTDGLAKILARFPADKTSGWATGGQVYLDFIRLIELMQHEDPHESRAVARRLLGALKGMEMREFLQRVSVREMASVVASWVLQTDGMENDKSKVLELPLCEDQYLKKTRNLSVIYYRARLQDAAAR